MCGGWAGLGCGLTINMACKAMAVHICAGQMYLTLPLVSPSPSYATHTLWHISNRYMPIRYIPSLHNSYSRKLSWAVSYQFISTCVLFMHSIMQGRGWGYKVHCQGPARGDMGGHSHALLTPYPNVLRHRPRGRQGVTGSVTGGDWGRGCGMQSRSQRMINSVDQFYALPL